MDKKQSSTHQMELQIPHCICTEVSQEGDLWSGYRNDLEEVEIIEANLCPDHAHMLVSIPLKKRNKEPLLEG